MELSTEIYLQKVLVSFINRSQDIFLWFLLPRLMTLRFELAVVSTDLCFVTETKPTEKKPKKGKKRKLEEMKEDPEPVAQPKQITSQFVAQPKQITSQFVAQLIVLFFSSFESHG